MQKPVKWNELKNKRLKQVRGVSFQEIVKAELIMIRENQARVNQRVFLYHYRNYIWVVLYIESEQEIFLKTLYPSRKYTKLFKRKVSEA